ncbi:unnamed protein product, partial [Discosporangium mesarthrocarpum]
MQGHLDAHMSASAYSSHADRKAQEEEKEAMRTRHSKELETLREQHDQAMQQLLLEKDGEYHKMAEGFKKQLNDVQLELLNNRQHIINTESQWRKRVEEVETREKVELARMKGKYKDHYGEQLARAKSEAAAANAALEGMSSGLTIAPEGMDRRSSGPSVSPSLQGYNGTRAEGADGMGIGVGEDPKLRSLALMLEESKKESRSLRDRNQELERVVEALRKTIMRQAELSSQRQEHQHQHQQAHRPPHGPRGRGMHAAHAHHVQL